MPSLFTSLAGALLSFLLYYNAVKGAGPSFAIDVRRRDVQFIDSLTTAGNVGVALSKDLLYTTNITLGGLNLTVILDTGSSDLVVDLNDRPANVTNPAGIFDIAVPINYGEGQVHGNIDFAELKLGDLVVDSLAFLDGVPAAFGDADGIMGLGFNAASNIQEALSQALGQEAAIAMGNTPMPALFAQDVNISHFFDVQLRRTAPGVFIIGSHDTDFQNVSNAPQLPSVASNHWSPVMDAMNVNGKAFAFNASRIANVPAGKVVAALDTGTSFPPLPAPAVDAIYSGIPGAEFDDVSKNWFVPCNGSTTLSFVFGNQEFFVHPLDLTFPMVTTVDGANRTACINTYQYSTIDLGDNTGFDLILGDAFLRNVYVSFNYGDEQNSSSTQPFVQMVSTTPDMAAALQEFQTQRAAELARLPPTVEPSAIVKRTTKNGARKSSSLDAAMITLAVAWLSLPFLM